MGIASTSFMGAMLGRKSSAAALTGTQSVRPSDDSVGFLERCHALGGAGVQTAIKGDPDKLRQRADQLGMWVEAMISVRNSSPEQLEQSIITAKRAGCTVARDGLLAGRRYETFRTLADWNAWVADTHKVLTAAVPTFEKHKLALAIENHKDWLIDDYVKLFRTYSSEYVGACLDFGNSISLLDNLEEVIEAAAPYTIATHLKDVAIAPYEQGFLLSEVVLGTGVLDLPKMVSVVQQANPKIHFSLEMITRDPLRVPCLTDKYWVTFPDRNGIYLARTLRYVHDHPPRTPLPKPEELSAEEHAKLETQNIVDCFNYARRMSAAV
jgi:sugar phosphate isomerase/epimerase